MDIFDTFATDEKLENEGKWFPLSQKAKVLVARSGNTRYTQVLRKKLEDNQIALNTPGPEADKLAEQLIIETMAETVLLGWEGLTYQKKEAPYSKAMAMTLLNVKDFRKKIQALADNFENYKVAAEEAQGNASANTSAGS